MAGRRRRQANCRGHLATGFSASGSGDPGPGPDRGGLQHAFPPRRFHRPWSLGVRAAVAHPSRGCRNAVFQTAAVALRACEHAGWVIASSREHALPQDISIAFHPPRQRLAEEDEAGEMDLVTACRRIQPDITRSVMTTMPKLRRRFHRPRGSVGQSPGAALSGDTALARSGFLQFHLAFGEVDEIRRLEQRARRFLCRPR